MGIQIQFTSLKDVRRPIKKNKTSLILNIIVFIFIAVNLGGLYAGNVFYKKAFEIDTKKSIDQFEANKQHFNLNRYNSLVKEEVAVTSTNNSYKLYGTYIKNPKPSKDTIILLHGLAGSRWSMLKYADMYLDKGFNLLIYDARNHGDSAGKNVTYGFYEKWDLDRWVNWLYTKNKGGVIGVHGESMGAATALLHSELNQSKKRVSFYICDSSYSDLKELFKLRLKEDYKLKSKLASNVLLFYADKVNKLRNQFNFEKASPINVIKEITTPVMLIHGSGDSFVPSKMSEDLHASNPSSTELYIAQNSNHVEAYLNHNEVYTERVYKFIDTILNSDKK
ncbi:alpha/beta hydrolase [Clostridium swellfunianum]|uniref:alpha/beta hydrolase n=1 Tax=Clostridium swellfunianum TaxID=1367462 RepID=UPI00202F4A42|nr:alpha/beta hydrolase [Clostridium swellfunianum]MCM0648353.1 alpha/beta hydrolase [Clostridium swellfunianum]